MIRLVCPVDPGHGPVQAVPLGWYCPHQAHDGRLRAHPLGEAPATRSFFTTAEVEAGQGSGSAARSDSTAVVMGASSARGGAIEPRSQGPDRSARL